MEICTKEHHGYFTLDMGYYEGLGFDSSALQNSRFSLVFIESGSGIFLFNHQAISFDAPVLVCANETELLSIEKDISVKAILFHPSIINSALNFQNIRTTSSTLSTTEMQDCFYLDSFVKRISPSYGVLFPNPDNSLRITKLFQDFYAQITLQDTDFWACRSRTYLIELLALANTLSHEKATLIHTEKQKKDDEILAVITYLKSNLYKKITILDLTKQFSMNRTDLSKRFLSYTGETIFQFLNRNRIEIAAAMLRDTLIPISEVTERAGFQDYSYFSRTFKKEKGISPKHYREQYCWMSKEN